MEMEQSGHEQIGASTPASDPLYRSLIDREIAWLTANPVVADIYTMRREPSGRVVLVVDSETDDDGDGVHRGERESRTPIYEEFENITRTMERAFDGENVFDDELTEGDRWGVWVSCN